MRNPCRFAIAASLAACLGAGIASAEHAHPAAQDTVDFPTSCDPAVRADFEHAVVLLHHMTYPQARAAFRDVARRDPGCAMAEWGIAMTLFTPLWPTRPSADDLRTGSAAVAKAQSIGTTTAREKAFIAAAAAFFGDTGSTDYWTRIDRWEAASAAAHAAFPDDAEASAFYALALLASARPGPAAAEHSRKAIELLLPVLKAHPNHPGAMHYIIHADDTPERAGADLDVVRGYEAVAPDNPHALHMPTHIYTRLGDWDGVIRGNRRAAEAALKYPAGEHGEYVWDEFPHAIEYLVYAYLQEGKDDAAAAQIRRLLATPKLEPTVKTAFHLSSTRARHALERHDWAGAKELVPRDPAGLDWDRYPWAEAVSVFARGYGYARTRGADEAGRAGVRLGELEARAAQAGEDAFARQIRMLRLELEGWTAHAGGDDATALARLREAVDLESATPKPAVTPAPTLPAAELLGDLLAEIGRPAEASEAYEVSLARYPRRFGGTLGAARARAASGDAKLAAQRYCELLRIAPDSPRAAIGEARAFVARDAAHSCATEAGAASRP